MSNINIIAETDHYVIVRCMVNSYYDEKEKDYILLLLEETLAKGYRPLHYENRLKGWVCEKPGVGAKLDKAA